MSRRIQFSGLSLLLGVAVLCAGPVLAYDQYSVNGGDATNCGFCHGDFRANGYVSLSDGQNWGSLHNLHRGDMLNNDCGTCHINGDTFPTEIGASDGGSGLAPLGCVGCHGRAEDGTGTGSEGYGLAMQKRHHVLNVGVDQNGLRCINCHPGIDTATPVGENVLPPYYANPGSGHPDMPTDPCNPPPDLTEDFAGLPQGLDNDGDLLSDLNDPDCLPQTPGETSGTPLPQMKVDAKNLALSTLDISYGNPCAATDNTIEFGPLSQVSSYGYSGAQCALGTSGTYTWNYTGTPDAMFFLVVANDGSVEGSYGTDSSSAERPADTLNVVCPHPQDLTARCD